MSLHGVLKVMNGRNGSRIQEELGETIKIYTAEEWALELKKRREEGFSTEAKPKKAKNIKDIDSLIEDDEDDSADEAIEPTEVVSEPVKVKRGRKASK